MAGFRASLKRQAKAKDTAALRLRREADTLHDQADALEAEARKLRHDGAAPRLPLWAMYEQGLALLPSVTAPKTGA